MKIFGYEILIIKVPKKKPRKKSSGYTSRPWTKEDDDQLLKMNARKLKHKTMASRLNRTIPAVYSRLNRIVPKGK